MSLNLFDLENFNYTICMHIGQTIVNQREEKQLPPAAHSRPSRGDPRTEKSSSSKTHIQTSLVATRRRAPWSRLATRSKKTINSSITRWTRKMRRPSKTVRISTRRTLKRSRKMRRWQTTRKRSQALSSPMVTFQSANMTSQIRTWSTTMIRSRRKLP